jgi:hypothetical protein
MKGIRDDLISVSNVVKQLGYTLILKPDDPECIPPGLRMYLPDDWEGFIKWDPKAQRLDTLPVRYNRRRRLWTITYSYGNSPEEARKANRLQHEVDTSKYAPAIDSVFQACEVEDEEKSEDPPMVQVPTGGDPELDFLFNAVELSVVTPTCRDRERRLTAEIRHRKMGHRGPCGQRPCKVCAQVFGKFRTIDKRYNPTVVRSNIPGETLYADVIYWDCMSRQGNRYSVVIWDDCTGHISGFHVALRSQIPDALQAHILDMRTNPETMCKKYGRWLFVSSGCVRVR